ncbi:MAG: helix-turn-helix domain-containing protein [Polyangiaceae bacterium]
MGTVASAPVDWLLVGEPSPAGLTLLVESPGAGVVCHWTPKALAAHFGHRIVRHWQFAEAFDLRMCTTRWIDGRGETVDDDALDGASLVSSSGVTISLAEATRLLGVTSPESFVKPAPATRRRATRRRATPQEVESWVAGVVKAYPFGRPSAAPPVAEALAPAMAIAGLPPQSVEDIVRPTTSVSRKAKRVAAVAIALNAGADWLDQYDSPLGKRKHLELCRKGVLPCRKNGKQRLVRRRDIDAHIEGERARVENRQQDVEEIDRELAALGLREP